MIYAKLVDAIKTFPGLLDFGQSQPILLFLKVATLYFYTIEHPIKFPIQRYYTSHKTFLKKSEVRTKSYFSFFSFAFLIDATLNFYTIKLNKKYYFISYRTLHFKFQ